MRFRCASCVLAALLAFPIGCGGSSRPIDGTAQDGSADGGGAPASAGLACQALNEAAAQLGARCSGGSLADWRAYQASNTDCAAYDRHVAEGTVEYHRELFATIAYTCGGSGSFPLGYSASGTSLVLLDNFNVETFVRQP